ncbi:MAG: hypothetical protein GWO41_03590 [candidate division Zixibacteria bacterium]|nr:hypothetical protein [candidate division Zixibacteria bacterium]NIR64032.1 hypothetical protein [candidate division Zixibacteria bacterium]NIS15317.1 hypothetical protein [candidate division Zixibacteria bacterium]NIS45951.1 hypothetical protein [candidate division Zixibacteria bacterium]NIT51840.1 hypothetical protein [candidate division Zixibacteria bacterium]
MAEKKNSFLIVLRSLVEHRGLILINVFVVTLAAVVISLLLPKWYKATAVILPPEKSESLSELAVSMGLKSLALSGTGFALPVMASPSDLLASIAESRTVAERAVEEMDLVDVYEVEKKRSAIGILRKQMDVHVRADGIIDISYEEKDPELAASVANSIVRQLDNINRMTTVQKATELKRFILEELEKNEVNLREAETALQEFQRTHKAVSLDEQTAASINAAAELYSQLTLDKINLKVMEKSHSPDHPDVINLRYKISEIEKRLRELQEGSAMSDDTSAAFLAIPFSEIPEISLRYMQLVRNLKREESLHEVLNTQLEQAKIMEAKDMPTISVLDWAVPPTNKFKPKRIYIVVTAMILSFVFSIVYAVAHDRWRDYKISNPERYKDISVIFSTLKKDLFGFKRRKS